MAVKMDDYWTLHICHESLAGLAEEPSCAKEVAILQNMLTNLLTLFVANTYFVFFVHARPI